MVADLEILGVPQSSFVWAVRLAAAEKGVPVTLHPERPHSDAVRAIHPLGKIPAMRHGDVTLFESRAIVAYIDATFDGPPLGAGTPAEEAWISLAITAIDQALVRAWLFAYIFPGTDDGAPDREKAAAAMPSVKAALAAIDAGVAKGEVLGKAFRLPDAWLTPMLHYAMGLPEWAEATAGLTHLHAGLDRALARPSTQATVPPPIPR
ncbi:MAG: glutathione S-transferase family protein [Pseudomonadota bacterium]